MSFILSVGTPVWYPIIDIQEGQYRFVFGWFSLIIVTEDIDLLLGGKVAKEKEG